MAMPDIPMYVFTGFLESGKTKFIQETLEDERFNTGERAAPDDHNQQNPEPPESRQRHL